MIFSVSEEGFFFVFHFKKRCFWPVYVTVNAVLKGSFIYCKDVAIWSDKLQNKVLAEVWAAQDANMQWFM